MTSATEYLYDHVTQKVLMEDMSFSERAPRPGDRIPRFDLPSVDGGRISIADIAGRKPLLLITGSYSCPMTASSDPILKEFHQEFGRDIEFVMLHVREAHPGEHREQPRSFEEKLNHAKALKARDKLPWPIAVDDPEGTLHRALDEKPNAVWLTDRDGVIVYRGLWAGDEKGLAQALDAVIRGVAPPERESQRRLAPMAMGVGKMREMTLQSGPRATQDLRRAAPPIAAMAWLADLYRPLPPKWRTVAAVATLGVAVSAITSAAKRRSNR
jgi:hypothetical protein